MASYDKMTLDELVDEYNNVRFPDDLLGYPYPLEVVEDDVLRNAILKAFEADIPIDLDALYPIPEGILHF